MVSCNQSFERALGEMRGKRKAKELNEHVRTLTTIHTALAKVKGWITSRQRKFFVKSALSIIASVLGSIGASLTLDRSFSRLSEIPQAYVYLAGIILSSLAGISIIFLLAREIYQQRKRERNQAIKEVRIRESQLFKSLEHDFENIVKRRELHGG